LALVNVAAVHSTPDADAILPIAGAAPSNNDMDHKQGGQNEAGGDVLIAAP
jgi:hypothetical protein